MKFNRNQAKVLTNDRELELFDESRAPRINKLTVKELKNFVKRSRTLRDKLRDVKRSQVRSKQAAERSRGVDPADRSREKAELFSQVHDAFVARLDAVEARAAKEKARSEAKKLLASAAKSRGSSRASAGSNRSVKATTASKAATDPEMTGKRSPGARAEVSDGKVKGAKIAKSGISRKRSHIASVNKRRQARRDSK